MAETFKHLAADGTPIEASCTRNGGQACDPNKLDHGRRLAGEERAGRKAQRVR